MSEEKKTGTFVVKDKRRFDADGSERPQAEESAPAPKADAAPPEGEPQEHGPLSFSSFVVSLATQALMMLGEIKPPEGMPIMVDRHAAKNTIDVLALMQEKTKGNLDADEERLLHEVLHNVRMVFLRKS